MRNNSLKKTIDHSIAAKKSLLLIEDKINQCIKKKYKMLAFTVGINADKGYEKYTFEFNFWVI